MNPDYGAPFVSKLIFSLVVNVSSFSVRSHGYKRKIDQPAYHQSVICRVKSIICLYDRSYFHSVVTKNRSVLK